MPRHRLPEGERKEQLNIRIRGKVIKELKELPSYNIHVEKAIVQYLERLKLKENEVQ